MSNTRLVLFGPQITFPSQEHLSWIRSLILADQGSLLQLRSLISKLHIFWESLKIAEPLLRDVDGSGHLHLIEQWLDTGNFTIRTGPLPTTFLSPLTVILQYFEYRFFRLKSGQDASSDGPRESLNTRSSFQGFCVGFVTAAIFSFSRNETEEFQLLRWALCVSVAIGACIDFQQASNEIRWDSMVVRWKAAELESKVFRAIREIEKAYISCRTDINEATVTLPSAQVADFTSNVALQGVSVKAIGLVGRFHDKNNQGLVDGITDFCERELSGLTYPAVHQESLLRSNADGEIVRGSSITRSALQSVLVRASYWQKTILAASTEASIARCYALNIGNGIWLPRSIAKERKILPTLPTQLLKDSKKSTLEPEQPRLDRDTATDDFAAHRYAVVGISCRFPGAHTPGEFWDLIQEGKSMTKSVPGDRFSATAQKRRPPNMGAQYWGNFLDTVGAFDNRFFRISPREAKSMDPQQRIMLELAYEALQSSGHFTPSSVREKDNVGIYLGVTTDDYRDNIAGHDAEAFSAVGSLRAFIAGRLSYFFNLTGPAITYDTACSSSSVAIHSACQALQQDDCKMALAGGINILSSPTTWENLAAGGFLSPTGPCKPFDASADGYCRGEGGGIVVLKKFSDAVADGDTILAVIRATALNQTRGVSSITVPSGRSQEDLYCRLLRKGKTHKQDVSFVEAHGTGTPVGDPIEYESIMRTFGTDRTERSKKRLNIGSVKANIGHTEAASGVASLIKVILMMLHRTIPPQAQFFSLNPKIAQLGNSEMKISTEMSQWSDPTRIACVNNYGAAGSNAMVLVSEHRPFVKSQPEHGREYRYSYPLLLCAKTAESLHSYCEALHQHIRGFSAQHDVSDIAFHMSRQQNHTLEYRFVTKAATIDVLRDNISKQCSHVQNSKEQSSKAKLPIVLVFGGQSSDRAHLGADLVRRCKVLHTHLGECQNMCSRLQLPNILPGIVDDQPRTDIVQLHCMLFAIQYSCARAWLDNGLHVDTVVGHSFGQLTALCIAGVISLEDALRLISGRALLIKKHEDLSKGAMLAIDLSDSSSKDSLILQEAEGRNLDVACFNGPFSFVLSGHAKDVDAFEEYLNSRRWKIRVKRLRMGHAFHSRLMDPVLPELKALANTIEYKRPLMNVELTTEETCQHVDAQTIVSHLRGPVKFLKTVRRIVKRIGRAIWLEAGSSSPVTSIVRRCLNSEKADDDPYLLLSSDLTSPKATDNLADITCRLWENHIEVNFWHYHGSQNNDYGWVHCPPYPFVASKHWLPYRSVIDQQVNVKEESAGSHIIQPDAPLVSLNPRPRLDESSWSFIINTKHDIFQALVSGHRILGEPIAPASLYFELVARAAKSLDEDFNRPQRRCDVTSFHDFVVAHPLKMESEATVELRLSLEASDSLEYRFQFRDLSSETNQDAYATGSLKLIHDGDIQSTLKGQTLKMPYKDLQKRMQKPEMESVQGSILYKLFNKVVDYDTIFKGVEVVASDGDETIYRARRRKTEVSAPMQALIDPIPLDYFVQGIGFSLNCLLTFAESEIWICTRIQEIKIDTCYFEEARGQTWIVYSCVTEAKSKHRLHDILVYDMQSERLIATLTGVRFDMMLRKHLVRSLTGKPVPEIKTANLSVIVNPAGPESPFQIQASSDTVRSLAGRSASISRTERNNIDTRTVAKTILSNATGIPYEDVPNDTSLEELGVDSLVTMDLSKDIKRTCNIDVSSSALGDIPDLNSLIAFLEKNGYRSSATSTHTSKSAEAQDKILSGETDPPKNETAAPAFMTNGNGMASDSLDTSGGFETNGEIESSHRRYQSLHERSAAVFENTRTAFDRIVEETGFAGFYRNLSALQNDLVQAYIIQAFKILDCDLGDFDSGADIHVKNYLPQYERAVRQFFNILEAGSIVEYTSTRCPTRTGAPIPVINIEFTLDSINQKFPAYWPEMKLLSEVGSRLGDFLSGSADPLQLLFRDEFVLSFLEQTYSSGPMHRAGSLYLHRFLQTITGNAKLSDELEVLEIGAGTGATTSWAIDALNRSGVKFRYTFTDISASLVNKARKRFSRHDNMHFTTLDIEKFPGESLHSKYHIVISTNCIHATSSVTSTLKNVHKLLRADGLVLLIEFTQNLAWFDIVFGLLPGWWNSQDGREHPLANESFWLKSFQDANFPWVNWTDGTLPETKLLRVLAASPTVPSQGVSLSKTHPKPLNVLARKQTIVYATVNGLSLEADIHFPDEVDEPGATRPIALLFHGGGHTLLTRSDIPPAAIKRLLRKYLPISVDYRLCPETTLLNGPMVDARAALSWVRTELAGLPLLRPDIVPNTQAVVAMGWSTGGQLAASLAWTAVTPPKAVVGWYCPTDYSDKFWQQAHYPAGSTQQDAEKYNGDVCEGAGDTPIAGYKMPKGLSVSGGWASVEDPRSLIVLRMNWQAKTVETLIRGTSRMSLENQRSSGTIEREYVDAMSPYAQIEKGMYHTPTLLVHGTEDDVVPFTQSSRTVEKLKENGVNGKLVMVQDAGHLFDLQDEETDNEGVWQQILTWLDQQTNYRPTQSNGIH